MPKDYLISNRLDLSLPNTPEHAREAIVIPATKQHVDFDEDAVKEILCATGCYPYFLQAWGQHCWQIAALSPITVPLFDGFMKRITRLDE